MGAGKKFVLRFSHKIVEHLGIKLYQNKPTNVVAELVSNAWDAEASEAWVDIDVAGGARSISAMDNGVGMTPEEIQGKYLVIGKPKRALSTPAERTPNLKRHPMGRKGIGKLAPFGIASEIHLISITGRKRSRKATWIALDIMKMQGDADGLEATSYEPTVHCEDAAITELKASFGAKPIAAAGLRFLERISDGPGTLIFMTQLSLKRPVEPDAVIESLGRRFTVTLLRPDFKVRVNGAELTQEKALPDFAFKIGSPASPIEDHVQVGRKQLGIKYWVGFVGQAQWPQDQAGIGVYTHGKLAQDRPFFFGSKGNELLTRYMFGVVEADWLDDLPDDLVSTDRTSIDWEHPHAAALKAWGESEFKGWIRKYQKYRKTSDHEKNVERVKKRRTHNFSPVEEQAIAELLDEISPALGNDDDASERAIDSLAGAWVHEPMRHLTKKLWDSLKDQSAGAENFLKVMEKLRDSLVPESLSLAVTFSQRIYAISLLHKRINAGTETDLQELITAFPWILQPQMEKLTANQTLKSIIEEAEERGVLTIPRIEADADKLRPDFIFFSPPGELDQILIVELKNPEFGNNLTHQNLLQLVNYMHYLKARFQDAKLQGLLIGNNEPKLDSDHKNIEIVSWSSVLQRSRKGHVELLASMLVGANPDPNSTWVAQVAQYGGAETQELLRRLAANDETLRALTERLDGAKQKSFAPATPAAKRATLKRGTVRRRS